MQKAQVGCNKCKKIMKCQYGLPYGRAKLNFAIPLKILYAFCTVEEIKGVLNTHTSSNMIAESVFSPMTH